MPLPEPTFDSRSYRELLNEALARIPAHNPEWTNFNDSDPGVTLLQLFAFLSEAIIYRANLIPERNRSKFLRLLGIPMRPAEAARGFVVFKKPKGQLKTEILEKDAEVSAGRVPFRTENGLQVLPIEAKIYYKSPLVEVTTEIENIYRKLYASYEEVGRELLFYETRTYETPENGNVLSTIDLSKDTVDGSLWLALLARPGDNSEKVRKVIAGQTLTLGILPSLSEEGCVLYPRGQSPVRNRPSLLFEMPIVEEGKGAAYERITAITDIDPLIMPGIVQLTLPEIEVDGVKKLTYWQDLDPLEPGVGNYPPLIEDSNDLDRLITWIRIRSPEIDVQTETSTRQLSVALSWVGINAAKIIQRTHVPGEQLPPGTGEPDQVATLTNTPVILDSVNLTVNGEKWARIDDLTAALPEIEIKSRRFAADITGTRRKRTLKEPNTAFTVDRESGEIRFGDGIHGKRPPKGAVIQVSYDYGGGKEGSVGIGTIKKGSNSVTSMGVVVNNPVPTWGGDERETVAEAEKRVPRFIYHRDRLVSQADYKEITENTPGVEIGRVEVLPLVNPEEEVIDAQQYHNSEGMVTVLVIPEHDPQNPDAPVPDRLFLQTICEYLSPRRIVTTELHVRGPRYVDIWISISIGVIPGHDEGPVREKVKQQLFLFLSPLKGGFEGSGWLLNKNVEGPEISAAAARVRGVEQVNEVLLGDTEGQKETPEIAIKGLQLPRIRAVSVVSGGNAPRIEEIRGDTPISGTGIEAGAGVATATTDRVGTTLPVPVVPDIC